MDAKLREFLKSRGISEDELDKIERGDAADDPVERLRKLDPSNPTLAKIQEINDFLYGVDGIVAKIKQSLSNILNADAQRESAARGVASMNGTHVNGAVFDLPNFLRGLK